MEALNPKTGRILCATNLSNKSILTYRYALQKARENNAKILVCYIISQRSIKAAKRLAYFLNETRKDIVKEKTYSALQRMKEQLTSFLKKELKDHPESADLIEHLLVYHGNVAEELVEKANRFGCEAIVLGSHCIGSLSRFLPGGTAKKVLKQTQKPVFLVSMKAIDEIEAKLKSSGIETIGEISYDGSLFLCGLNGNTLKPGKSVRQAAKILDTLLPAKKNWNVGMME